MNPRLSVVVPFYGVEDYLAECLESLRRQTMTDMQVILVDDGSPDRSIDIAEEFAGRDERFQVVRQANAGLGPARNTGTEHAEGTFLTFVDSDDIVPRRAYEHMVASLERSGSSFAVGNARRFSRTSGVRQSWAHSRPCAKDATATHILERPELTYDRMVWNKVYRKDFWDEHGYAFPPIKYEDWPVTMKAHLDALTVDILRTPTYYWRERESGDSITQQVFKYENLLDRVISAEKVFEVLDRQASPAVRSDAHKHLLEIDMVAIAQAFAVAEDDEVEQLLDLSKRFIERLEAPASHVPRYNQLQYRALKAGDPQLLRELAIFRDEGGLLGGARARRNRVKPWRWTLDYPGRARSQSPKHLYDLPFTSLSLKTLVTSVRWSQRRLDITATAQIGHLVAQADDRVSVSLVNGITRVPLQHETFETIDAFGERAPVGIRFGLSLDEIAALDDVVWPLRFEVERTTGGVHRKTILTGAGPGSPAYPSGAFLTPDQYVQPGLTWGNIYCLHRVPFPAVLHEAEGQEGHLTVEGTVAEPTRSASVVVVRPGRELEFPVDLTEGADGRQHFRVSMSPHDLLSGDAEDDPFLHTATRAMYLRTEFGDMNLTWADYAGDQSVTADERVVSLTRSPFGIATLTHGPVRPSVRDIEVLDDVLRLSGPRHGDDLVGSLTWRKYLPESDDHIDIAADVRQGDDAYMAETTLASLIPDEDLPTQPGAPGADYTLFFSREGSDNSVPIQPSALASLPIERWIDGRQVLVTSVAGGTRVQVR